MPFKYNSTTDNTTNSPRLFSKGDVDVSHSLVSPICLLTTIISFQVAVVENEKQF